MLHIITLIGDRVNRISTLPLHPLLTQARSRLLEPKGLITTSDIQAIQIIPSSFCAPRVYLFSTCKMKSMPPHTVVLILFHPSDKDCQRVWAEFRTPGLNHLLRLILSWREEGTRGLLYGHIVRVLRPERPLVWISLPAVTPLQRPEWIIERVAVAGRPPDRYERREDRWSFHLNHWPNIAAGILNPIRTCSLKSFGFAKPWVILQQGTSLPVINSAE